MKPLTQDQVWGVEPAAKNSLCPLSEVACAYWLMDESGNGYCSSEGYCFFKYHDIATEDTEVTEDN